MTQVIERQIAEYQIVIFYDEYPLDPRDFHDNLGTMICFHKKYQLGDNADYESTNYDSWQGLHDDITTSEDVHTILPVYMYDHSGITISVYPFNDPWDSGQIGYIYCTKKQAKTHSDYSVRQILIDEVSTYDKYLRGEVFGWEVRKDGEVLDSCSGYYDQDTCQQDALSYIQQLTK